MCITGIPDSPIYFLVNFLQINGNHKNYYMKKIKICVLALLTVFTMQAQNKKGNYLVGTSFFSSSFNFGESHGNAVGSSTISTSESNNFSIGVNTNAGKYLTDKIVVGPGISIGVYNGNSTNSSSANSNTSKSNSHYFYFGVGPFARFYLGKLSSKGMPYAQVGGSITFYPGYKGDASYSNSPTSDYDYNYSGYHPFGAYVQFGYEHYFNQIIALHYYIAYNYSRYEYTTKYHSATPPDTEYHNEGHSNNIGFGIGLQIHLECNKSKKK